MTINPYQPVLQPESVGESEATPDLHFDGVIEREDYAALLPNDRVLWWLQATLLLLLVPAMAMGGAMTLASLIKDGVTIQSLITLAMTGGLLALAVLTATAIGRGWRSRTHLTRFPDLLGIAHGEFTLHGLLFHDGKRQHWFGPSVLATSAVSKAGIRVPLPGSPYRYLAFTKRLFKAFNVGKAAELQTAWRKKAERRSHSELHPVANLWSRATESPDGAVSFKGYCSIKEPMKSREIRHRAMFETVVTGGTLGVAITFATDLNHWFWGAAAYSLFSAYACVQSWRQYFYGEVERGWYQYGWLSTTQLATCIHEMGTILDRTEIVSVNPGEGFYTLTTTADNHLFIFRQHVADDTQWMRLAELLSLASAKHDTTEAVRSSM